jgi:hypothetical protein
MRARARKSPLSNPESVWGWPDRESKIVPSCRHRATPLAINHLRSRNSWQERLKGHQHSYCRVLTSELPARCDAQTDCAPVGPAILQTFTLLHRSRVAAPFPSGGSHSEGFVDPRLTFRTTFEFEPLVLLIRTLCPEDDYTAALFLNYAVHCEFVIPMLV